jgi:hypothetical protein
MLSEVLFVRNDTQVGFGDNQKINHGWLQVFVPHEDDNELSTKTITNRL